MSKLAHVWVLSLSGVFGCSLSQAGAPSTSQNSGENVESTYAAALDDAFAAYADEIYSAALLEYGSVAEAEAVVRTLSGQHFDHVLAESLSKRGLSMTGLAGFAEKHASFFHEQQRLHWGKLQTLETTLASLPSRVKPADIDDSMLAFDVL